MTPKEVLPNGRQGLLVPARFVLNGVGFFRRQFLFANPRT
jgi:hypothetical protein